LPGLLSLGIGVSRNGAPDPADACGTVTTAGTSWLGVQGAVSGVLSQLGDAVTAVPSIGDCEITGVWKGWRPTTRDGLPILDRISPNVVVALGFSGLGYTLAPAVARIVTDLIDGVVTESYSEFRLRSVT